MSGALLVARMVVDVVDLGDQWYADGQWVVADGLSGSVEAEVVRVGGWYLVDEAAAMDAVISGSEAVRPGARRVSGAWVPGDGGRHLRVVPDEGLPRAPTHGQRRGSVNGPTDRAG